MVATFITGNLKGCLTKELILLKRLIIVLLQNLDYYGTKTLEFNGSCLKQDSVTFNHRKVVNIYIVYEIRKSINIRDYPTLENCLFGAVILTKNANPVKKHFNKPKHFIIICHSFSVNNCECLKYHQLQ